MRSLPRVFYRVSALSLVIAGAGLFVVPACSLINSESDCQSACDVLNKCGVIHTGDCGLYCAGLVVGAGIAGCGDQFDAQNQCGKDNGSECTTAAVKCAPQAKAFSTCMAAYCMNHPDGQGCPQTSGTDGGT